MPPKKAAQKNTGVGTSVPANTSAKRKASDSYPQNEEGSDSEYSLEHPRRSKRLQRPSTKAQEIIAAKAEKEAAHSKNNKMNANSTIKKTSVAQAKKSVASKKQPSASGTSTAAKGKKSSTTATSKGNKATATTKSKNASNNTAAKKATGKRKAADDDGDSNEPPAKKRAPSPPAKKALPAINHPPTQRLDVFVFGEGGNCELGLGPAANAVGVKRPRLNHLLSRDEVGVVSLATGGMHVMALTHDNKILTWGVNDQGALGRDTEYHIKDDASDGSDDSEDNGLNPRECTPGEVPAEYFPKGTVFASLAAGDSCSFAITQDGSVYGWGTFRANDGILGFSQANLQQRRPILIPQLKKITSIACGANHALALDTNGNVFAWGAGEQNQLGRRIVERTRLGALTPREFGLPKKQIRSVACGSYHSFAIDKKGQVWSWGLNSFAQCGVSEGAGEANNVVPVPTKVRNLAGASVQQIKGGADHSIAVAGNGDCLVWGRADGAQLGLDLDKVPQDELVHDQNHKPRIVLRPTRVPGFSAVQVTAESDHCIAVTGDGKAFSWGFNTNYQTGQGNLDQVDLATLVDNTAVRDRAISWAGAGGQYGVLAAPAA
ncbi:MAG: hypothetical protein M1831_000424 [Alyxoria varia]|nr:MAG: hypothetical protein M1831_000424 [Alyxoria varia]